MPESQLVSLDDLNEVALPYPLDGESTELLEGRLCKLKQLAEYVRLTTEATEKELRTRKGNKSGS